MSECFAFSLRKKTLRENAQPYRFWGLLGFLPRSERNGMLHFKVISNGC
jgi:hypothetical protein